jgi:hypothetical protein
MIFRTGQSYAERMRITSGGNLLIGTTSDNGYRLRVSGGIYTSEFNYFNQSPTAGQNALYVNQNMATTLSFFNMTSASTKIIDFGWYGGSIASISINGAGNAVAYNTTSDYRLKEDYKEINGLEKVSAIKVYDFKWKKSNDRMDGVIAHELSEVLPYAVFGEKDGKEMQQVDYSKIVPVLIKSVQELKQELDTLKNK